MEKIKGGVTCSMESFTGKQKSCLGGQYQQQQQQQQQCRPASCSSQNLQGGGSRRICGGGNSVVRMSHNPNEHSDEEASQRGILSPKTSQARAGSSSGNNNSNLRPSSSSTSSNKKQAATKENLDALVSKLFFNSPRYLKKMNDSQKLKSLDLSQRVVETRSIFLSKEKKQAAAAAAAAQNLLLRPSSSKSINAVQQLVTVNISTTCEKPQSSAKKAENRFSNARISKALEQGAGLQLQQRSVHVGATTSDTSATATPANRAREESIEAKRGAAQRPASVASHSKRSSSQSQQQQQQQQHQQLPESYEAALDEKTAAAAANKRPLTSSSKKTKKKSAAPVASVPLIQRMIGADNGNANTTVSPKSPKQVPFFFSSRTSPTANQVVQALRSEKENTEQNATDAEKPEYREYKKLQDKLSFLESKILSIKSTIDQSKEREKGAVRAPLQPTASVALVNTAAPNKGLQCLVTQVKRPVCLESGTQQKQGGGDQQVTTKALQSNTAKNITPQGRSVNTQLTNKENVQAGAVPTAIVVSQQHATGQRKELYYVSQIARSFASDITDTDCNSLAVFQQIAREHLQQTIQALSFSRLLKPVAAQILKEKSVCLAPKRDKKKTIVFDLDETLIHCNESSELPADVVLPITFPNGEVIEAGIMIRPHCQWLLRELSKLFEIVVFTASHSCYANVVLDHLDPARKYVQYRLFRENCVQTEEGVYIKDLRVIQNRALSDLLIVDNAAYSFGMQVENGIPIIPYYNDINDTELKSLYAYLRNFQNVTDVRPLNKRLLKLEQYEEFQEPSSLLQALYPDYHSAVQA